MSRVERAYCVGKVACMLRGNISSNPMAASVMQGLVAQPVLKAPGRRPQAKSCRWAQVNCA
ncbi:hypothetical protein [Burkholderia sp. F1]|uniref:hypothetical protein n=1 Tax=Burkholderia sp. F1 TaxID=3366817 RepID=UPI003D73B6E8